MNQYTVHLFTLSQATEWINSLHLKVNAWQINFVQGTEGIRFSFRSEMELDEIKEMMFEQNNLGAGRIDDLKQDF